MNNDLLNMLFFKGNLVILNKCKSEIQNAEFDVVNNLLTAVSASDYKFDNVRAKVAPSCNLFI